MIVLDTDVLTIVQLLENLGIDKVVRFGNLADWKAAIAELEKNQGASNRLGPDPR